jgi:hypothetical protein
VPTRADFLREQFMLTRTGIETIEQRAVAEERDLTPEENAQCDALYARATEIGAELEPIAARHRSMTTTAQILADLGIGHVTSQPTVRHEPGYEVTDVSPGEYAASYVRAANPHNPNRMADLEAHCERYRVVLVPGAGGQFRTVATQITTDTAGILPVPILGPVSNIIDANRYVIPSLTQRPMPPSGAQFTRPKITQHVDGDYQTAELAELTSRKMIIGSDTVTKRTWGESLQLSQQDIDWTDPGALQILFDDFTDIYTKKTDATAATSLVAAVTATVAWTATSVGTILTSLTNAAASVYASASAMPDTLWLSLDEGLALAALTTSTGDLVFPNFGAGQIDLSSTTLGGGRVLGLEPHICPNLPTDTRIMGVRRFYEWYEQRNGFLQVAFPSALKLEVAYYGYTAFYALAGGGVRLV